MKPKKTISTLLVLSLILTLFFTACGKNGEDDGNKSDATATPNVSATEAAATEAAATEATVTEAADNTKNGGGTENAGNTEAETKVAEIPEDANFKITYTLYNTEGKYADLAVGPLIAVYNVLDYGADATGEKDNTKLLQSLINRVSAIGGGTLYIPEGLYRVEGSLRIPRGVTIRGDWTKPDKTSPIDGTVLMAYIGADKSHTDTPFIEMELGAGVMNMSIWYPEQDPNNIKKYSPAIRMGVNGYFGNEYNNVKDVTLVNTYIGVLFSYTNGGASPVVNGLYGTPLHTGVDIDNIADVGRVEWLDFAADYWINSGLYERLGIDNPFKDASAAEAVKDFIYNNGTGLIMRRNDWSYATYLTVDGYLNGYLGAHSVGSPGSTPNGHNYDFHFINCKNGVNVEATNGVGVLFNKVVTENCETGIRISPSTAGAVQFANCVISGQTAIDMDETSGTRFLLNESEIVSGGVNINGGTLNVTDVDFNNKTGDNPHVSIGSSGRINMSGCRFNGEPDIKNSSFFLSNISHEPIESKDSPVFEDFTAHIKKPARFVVYVATDPEFGAVADNNKTDNTEAIQKALDKAAADGGGYVYLPGGRYRLDGGLVIPGGVELIGSMANSSTPHGEGAILGCYYGENDQNALPFLQLEENSGIRGLTIDYPNQIYKESDNYAPHYYPYSIQGKGDNVYIINVGVRATYAALDLFTYKCDNFYVDYLTGHMFNVGARIGGNSENGVLSNLMCNTIVYACGQESKFGSFPNSPGPGVSNGPLYEYGMLNLDFLILGDCTGLTLYNCFNFGSYRGIIMRDDGNGGPQDGISMGLALDGDTYTFYIEEGVTTKNFDFINTQFVTLTNNYSPNDTSYIYSEGNNDFDITLFTSDYWGSPIHGIFMGENSGRLTLEAAHFDTTGNARFINTAGGYFTLQNGSVSSLTAVAGGADDASRYVSITGAMIREEGIDTSLAVWANNIPTALEFSPDGAIANNSLDRFSWSATASHGQGNVTRAFDSNIGTRWDTAATQSPGQYFILNLGSEQTFNYLILDVGSSISDGPMQYDIYVSSDGENWSESLASGSKGNGIIPFETQTASFIKIEQNGSDGLYWSIHEIYVCLID